MFYFSPLRASGSTDVRIKWKIAGLRVRDRDPLRVVPGRASAVKISQINYVVIPRELGLSMNILVHTPYQLVVVMYHGADVGSPLWALVLA